MVFWGKCYHSQQILVKNAAEEIILLTAPLSDLEEITYTNLTCLNIYPCERVKKEKWKLCAAVAQVGTWPGLVDPSSQLHTTIITVPHWPAKTKQEDPSPQPTKEITWIANHGKTKRIVWSYFVKGSIAKHQSCLPRKTHCTFSTSDRDDSEWFCRTSGAVNARRSCWDTFSSVNDTLPDGSNSRDHGEMMNPRAAGSAVIEKGKKKTTNKTKMKQCCLMPLLDVSLLSAYTLLVE